MHNKKNKIFNAYLDRIYCIVKCFDKSSIVQKITVIAILET